MTAATRWTRAILAGLASSGLALLLFGGLKPSGLLLAIGTLLLVLAVSLGAFVLPESLP